MDSIINAMNAPAKLTSDSMASDKRPMEPVKKYAPVLSTMVTRAAPMDSQANLVGCRRQRPHHVRHRVEHIATGFRGAAMRNPVKAVQTHCMIDANCTGVTHDVFKLGPIRDELLLAQDGRRKRRQPPILSMFKEGIRRCTDARTRLSFSGKRWR